MDRFVRAFVTFLAAVLATGAAFAAAPQTAATPQKAPGAAPAAAAAPLGTIKRQYTLALGLRDGKRYLGDVQTTLDPDGTVAVDAGQVLTLLKPMLNADAFARLQKAIGTQGKAPLSAFAQGGVPASFDQSMLQVVLTIAPTARLSQSLDIASLDRALIGSVAQPAGFSGYLNLRGSADYVETGAETGPQNPLILMDGAVRLHGFVLEGEAQYAPGQQGEDLTRQGTRLVYDDRNNLMRWTLGDLQVQADGFQGTPNIAGLSVMRVYDQLAPQENVRPRGNRSFTLQHASTVETLVNGQQVRKVRLGPGTYDASNFPFVEGANNVQLIITDDSGATETLNFSIFFDRSLLMPGRTEFGAFAGVNALTENGSTHYPDAKPLFTGFVRHGFSNALTAGGNLQADRNTQMGGLDALWGSPIGTIGLDLAGSHDRNLGSGYAVNLTYRALFQEQNSFRTQSLDAAFEMRSRNFAILNQDNAGASLTQSALAGFANNPYKWQASLSYQRAFSQYTFGQLQASYAAGRGAQDDIGTVTGTVGYGLTEDANMNVSLGYSSGGFQKGINVGVQLTWRLGRESNLRAEYQSDPQLERLTYQQSHGRGEGAWSVSGSLDHAQGALDFNGSANYSANRAELGLAQTSTYGLKGNQIDDQRTTLQVGTSLAFAGGTVAVGRPIYDSFALFDPHPSLKDARVRVDPGPDGDLASSDALGAAVLNDLGSYSLRTVTYDVPTAPAGYNIGNGTLRVLPPYRSGYAVTVGSAYHMLAVGRLLDRDGKPLELLAGTATEMGVRNGKTLTVFTSRDGRFGASGLKPGHWRIDMPTKPATIYDIVVPDQAGSLIRLGDIKPVSTETKP